MHSETHEPIQCRVLGPEDQEAFYELRLEALRTSPHSVGTGHRAWEQARPEQILALLKHSASPEDGCILGAFVAGGELVGMLGLRRETKGNVRHKGTLWGFFVRPGWRRRGIGGSLVDEALERAEGYEGLVHVRLIVTVDDREAVGVFGSRGFEEYGLERQGICCEGRYFDQSYMIKTLESPTTAQS